VRVRSDQRKIGWGCAVGVPVAVGSHCAGGDGHCCCVLYGTLPCCAVYYSAVAFSSSSPSPSPA
jgi:hypothetical protein